MKPQGSRVLTHNYSHLKLGSPAARPSSGVSGDKHPTAWIHHACLPREREHFINVSFKIICTVRVVVLSNQRSSSVQVSVEVGEGEPRERIKGH